MTLSLSRPMLLPLLASAGLAVWLALFWRGPVINDVAWQLWIGREMIGGASLYRDIMEVNPPLWFWLGAGIQRIAAVTSASGFHLLLCAFAAVAALSIGLSLLLTKRREEGAAALFAVLATLFLTSPWALGQREQYAFLAAMPYLVLAERRQDGARTSARLALLVGAFAASGLLLKPHFLLVPLALEAWLLFRSRRLSLRPELLALALAGIGYAAAVLLRAPAYLSDMVPLIRTAYHGYEPGLVAVLFEPTLLATLITIAAVAASRRDGRADAALVAAIAFAIAAIWQGKAFAYHAIPALGCALLALGLSAHGLRRARLAIKAALVVALVFLVLPLLRPAASGDAAATAATRDLKPGASILMLSASGSAAWPLIEQKALGWPVRHMTLWMLISVWDAERKGDSDPKLRRIEADIRNEIAHVMLRRPPQILLIDHRYDELAPGGVLGWFAKDARFALALKGYRREQDSGYLSVYRRMDR